VINVRKAQLSDVPRMMPLLNEYAKQAEILPRMEADVYQSIRDWVVAEAGGKIVGMGSLLIMWGDLAEIRSLVIDPACQGQGVGRAIVSQLLAEARALELPRVFALTRKPGFFLKMGFQLTPATRWRCLCRSTRPRPPSTCLICRASKVRPRANRLFR